jgi:CubicO group peptidase (beta-lactamase class C family)
MVKVLLQMKKLMSALLAPTLLASVMLVVSQDSATGQDEVTQAKAALRNLLDEQVQQQDIPGMVMAARLADGTVIWDTSGYISPSGQERWNAHTVSALGSITKTFTAVVVMQLVEEGKLSLDDTVDAWFPELPNGNKITIRMLLSHTSGIANFSEVLGNDIEKWTREWTPEELIAEAVKAGPVSEPGSNQAHYSNTAYFMLGLIIEKITGHSWAQEVESRIIEPLDLKDTTFIDKEGVWGGVLIPGYTKTPDGYLSTLEFPWYPHVSTGWTAGAIVSSISDLMTFAGALFDGRLVSKETLAVMVQPLGSDGEREWALGGAAATIAGRQGFGMGGDVVGYHAFFIGIPDSKLVVTALVNTEEGDVISPSIAALEYLIEAR